jgi:choline-glycine betaine transporter
MKKIKPIVFLPPFLLLLAVIVLNFTNERAFTSVLTNAYGWVIDTTGWLVVLLALFMLLICVVVYFSPFGRIIIGGPDARPLLTKWRLFAIILCTDIAIGVLFWGPVEPMYYLSGPPESLGIEPNTPDAALFAISKIYLHWTSIPYSIAAIVGLMFAFAYYNMKKPFSLGAPLSPLLGRRGTGITGQVIDAVCLYTLVAGMAGSLGGAMMLIGGGVNHVLGIEGKPSDVLLAIITAAIVGTFIVSAVTGLMKGIRKLSNINTVMLIGFLVIIIVAGPTGFIIKFGMEGFGHFMSHFFENALFTGAAHQDPWASKWTMMHFANWFAWAPIMGLFLGRIAYGYNVRTFLLFNVVLPAVFTAIWMGVFAGATIHMELYEGVGLVAVLEENGLEGVLYTFMEQLPLARLLIPVLLATAFLSFVTAADSNTSAMSSISSTGISPENPEPSMGIKIIWGLMIGLLAWVMITFARLDGIRMLSNLGGLPALILCLAVIIGLVKVTLNPKKYDTFKNGYDKEGQPKI